MEEETGALNGNKMQTEAIHQLLKHVKIDPDGGILNLVDSTEESKQTSKLPALQKNNLESMEALCAAFRSVCNPIAMVFLATHCLQQQLFTAEGLDNLREELRRLRLGHRYVMFSFIGANVLEFCLGAGFILLTLYHVCMIFYHKHRSPPTPDKPMEDVRLISASTDEESGEIGFQEVLNPRYMYEAQFWLTDLPRLQNLSIFRVLALAHPNLLEKRRKQFSSENEMARAVLESFFKCKGKYLTDEQLVEEVAKVIAKANVSLANEELWNLNPSGAVQKLREARRSGSLDSNEQQNAEVLDKAWRLDLLVFGERLGFFVFVLVCFMLGALEFLHKICRCTLMLTDPERYSMLTCLLYFALFLNQTIGMMHISLLLRMRVETFIFGGADAVVSTEEHYVMRVYLGLLIERIWDLNTLKCFQKVAIMLTLDDDDLQQLVVEESESKATVTASIRQFMDKRGLSNKVYAALQRFVAE
jgi:hypothetical protein